MSSIAPPNPPLDVPVPCEILPGCPVCGLDRLTKAAELLELVICACMACGTTLSVPREALRQMRARLNEAT